MLKITYNKLQSWYNYIIEYLTIYTKSKYAMPLLIATAFTESSFFILPPDVLLIAMAFAVPAKAFLYAFITTVSSIAGGAFGYLIGFLSYDEFLKDIIVSRNYSDKFNLFAEYYNKYGMLAIFIAGFTPIPYKIATIASGVFKVNFLMFIIVSFFSRGLRFFLLAILIRFYHARGKSFIASHFKKIVLISTLIIVVLVVVIIMYLMKR